MEEGKMNRFVSTHVLTYILHKGHCDQSDVHALEIYNTTAFYNNDSNSFPFIAKLQQ